MAGQEAQGLTASEISETTSTRHDWTDWLFPRAGLRLRVWTCGNGLHIAVQGRMDADMILEDLHIVLSEPRPQTRLHLDLAGVPQIDDLGVSALIVLLRHRGPSFHGVCLTGLPPLAVWRLRDKGARELLGGGWQASFQGDQARYRRH
ncbi:MAG: hypothetical protein V1806_14190 [Pseudomonadota bacterium]